MKGVDVAQDAPVEKQAKRRGRPRKDGSKSGNQRGEIVAAALDLFSRKGYASTTLSDIARAAGLSQSSVYYWFSGKDDILQHVMNLNRLSLEVAGRADTLPGNAAERLRHVLEEDARMLCRLPFDYYVLEEAAHSQPDDFTALIDDYRALQAKLTELIEAGVAEGSLAPCDAQTEAALAMAVNEGVQHRFHRPGPAGAGLPEDAEGKACSGADRDRLIEQMAQAAANATLAKLAKR